MSASEIMDMKDKARLELTLNTRERIINSLVGNGKLPESMEDRDFLLKTLDGMDRTVLSKAKIKVEDKAAQGQQASARMIGDILSRLSVNNNLDGKRNSPELGEEFKISNIVPGETEIGSIPIELSNFVDSD